jgi:hypothetical protein
MPSSRWLRVLTAALALLAAPSLAAAQVNFMESKVSIETSRNKTPVIKVKGANGEYKDFVKTPLAFEAEIRAECPGEMNDRVSDKYGELDIAGRKIKLNGLLPKPDVFRDTYEIPYIAPRRHDGKFISPIKLCNQNLPAKIKQYGKQKIAKEGFEMTMTDAYPADFKLGCVWYKRANAALPRFTEYDATQKSGGSVRIKCMPMTFVRKTSTTQSSGASAAQLIAKARKGYDRPGSDYRNFQMNTPSYQTCASKCAGEAKCKAWTFVKPGVQGPKAKCYLKSRAPKPVKNACCTSGAK